MSAPISLAKFYEKYWLVQTPNGPKKPVLTEVQRELLNRFEKGEVTYPMLYTHRQYFQ